MPKEAGLLLMELAKFSSSVSEKKEIMGKAHLLMGKYREARKCLEKVKNHALANQDYWWAKGLENWNNKKKS